MHERCLADALASQNHDFGLEAVGHGDCTACVAGESSYGQAHRKGGFGEDGVADNDQTPVCTAATSAALDLSNSGWSSV